MNDEKLREDYPELFEETVTEEPKKPRKKKKRRKKHYLLRFILLIAVIVGLYKLATSPIFDIQKITVEGNNYFTSEQVVSRSEIAIGGNIFFDVKSSKTKSALITDPYIKNVVITRSLPSTVVITVEERVEAAAIPYSDNFVIVDNEGLVLRTTEVDPKLPLLAGLTIKEMETGKALEVEENSMLNGTLDMLKAMQGSEVFFKKIDLSKVMARAYVYDSLVCQGMPEDIMKSLNDGTLQSLLFELYSQGIEHGTVTVTADTSNMAFSPIYE